MKTIDDYVDIIAHVLCESSTTFAMCWIAQEMIQKGEY